VQALAAEQLYPHGIRPSWSDQLFQEIRDLRRDLQRDMQRDMQHLYENQVTGFASVNARLTNNAARRHNVDEVRRYREKQLPGDLMPVVRERSVAPERSEHLLRRMWGPERRGQAAPQLKESQPGEFPHNFPSSVLNLRRLTRQDVLELATFYNDFFGMSEEDSDEQMRDKFERFIYL